MCRVFDQHARDLINDLPKLPGIDPTACRRTLSRAYLFIVESRLNTATAEGSRPDPSGVITELRRLGDALESVAVFDPLHGVQIDERTRAASAFVAAEALSLLSALYPVAPAAETPDDPVRDARLYTTVESALLYMIGGYDVNAVAAVSSVPKFVIADPRNAYETRTRAGKRLLRRVSWLCQGIINHDEDGRVFFMPQQPALLNVLLDDTRARLYESLIKALDSFAAWLAGKGPYDAAKTNVSDVINATSVHAAAGDGLARSKSQFSDIYHLASLLAVAFECTANRSVVHRVPVPTKGNPFLISQFTDYIHKRALGSLQKPGRPLLWPSTLEYIKACLPGPHKDAVVSMPTGSGKSFLAELAIAHALPQGWVLYLTPTNALAQQVRRDLARALAPFEDVTVSAFIGGAEYAALKEAEIENSSFVGVMTPEKCALALRLYPDAFAQCSLCVFDECHLLNDDNRGAVADVLLAQLFYIAPSMRVLLMSAMISNADELAAWLTSVRGQEAIPSKIKWRPSRAARGFVFVDKEATDKAALAAKPILNAATGAKTITTEIPIGWLVGLSGPWTHDGPDDYRVALLPVTAPYYEKRKRDGTRDAGFESWKNTTGQSLAEMFASKEMPTINFVMTSRHHAFSNAEKVAIVLPGAVGIDGLPDLINAQLAIADAELGVETALRNLLSKGIAVHTSAMLPVEQAASESMFSEGKAKLMFATGTLAQGLNLPALVVIVSGSQLPRSRKPEEEVDASAGLTRATELILNGFGRAGRPGFANQGVVILVSDDARRAPINSTSNLGVEVLANYPVLGEPDASVVVTSPIEKLLDQLLLGDDVGKDATALHLTLTSLLSAFDAEDENAGAVLRRTFAGYRRRGDLTAERAALANERIQAFKDRFLQVTGVPAWMARAAMKGGVDFFLVQRIWEAYQARGPVTVEAMNSLDVRGWFDVLIEVLAMLPIDRIKVYLDDKKTETPRTTLYGLASVFEATLQDTDVIPWMRPDGWYEAWRELGNVVMTFMEGRPFTEVGAKLFGSAVTDIKSKRADPARGIPAVFKFLADVVDRALSMDAGCFLALIECWLEDEHPGIAVPEALQALPLCIKNGCDTLNTLAWYRFGFRQRMCSQALAMKYPIPLEFTQDTERRSFVRKAKRKWLDEVQTVRPSDFGLLDFARIVVLDGASERS